MYPTLPTTTALSHEAADLDSLLVPKSKKSKKRKGGKARPVEADATKLNGIKSEIEEELEPDEEGEKEGLDSRTPTDPPGSPLKAEANHTSSLTNGSSGRLKEPPDRPTAAILNENHDVEGSDMASKITPMVAERLGESTQSAPSADTNARLEALVNERDALREEVAQARRSLEEIQEKHEEELGSIREQLADTQGEKEQAESQYRSLLGKVNSIKSQLGERLKADAEDLSQARSRIEDLEEQCGNLREQNEARSAELIAMAEEGEHRSKELSSLRNRTTLSQQNFSKEREDLIRREAFAKEEFEAAKQAMQDWEVLAMEERTIRESLAERITDLEEQIESHREAHERAASERDSQSLTVDGLQRALQEIQDGMNIVPLKVLRLLILLHSSKAGVARNRRELTNARREPTKTIERSRKQGSGCFERPCVYERRTRKSHAFRERSQGEEPSYWQASA